MKLRFVLAEAALELVPKEAWKHPAVAADARRRGREPGSILLDRSTHHEAMLRLKDGPKRGRPDLVHSSILAVTGSPLYLEGRVALYVHTSGDIVLEIEERTRVPKSYNRFRGLVEKALSEEEGSGLVKAYRSSLPQLIKKLGADRVWGLSTQGAERSLDELAEEVVRFERPCVVVGGFPHGHFAPEVVGACDELVRIHAKPLEAHVVTSRLVYEIEKRVATAGTR